MISLQRRAGAWANFCLSIEKQLNVVLGIGKALKKSVVVINTFSTAGEGASHSRVPQPRSWNGTGFILQKGHTLDGLGCHVTPTCEV